MDSTLEGRLVALLGILDHASSGGRGMSSAAVGVEREAVATSLLGNVIAPPFRLGSGDIIDSSGNHSGQMDIVVEHTPSISIPLMSGLHPRLYLAEGVAAVVEVKSDVTRRWSEVEDSSDKLGKLKRDYEPGGSVPQFPSDYIPYYVVVYKGYKRKVTLQKHVENIKGVYGVLSVRPCFYCSRNQARQDQGLVTSKGPIALLMFMIEIELQIKRLFGILPKYDKYDEELFYKFPNTRFIRNARA